MIIKFSNSEKNLPELNKNFDSVEIKDVIIAKNKTLHKNLEEFKFVNNNRMPESELQSKKTLEIIKKVLKNQAK